MKKSPNPVTYSLKVRVLFVVHKDLCILCGKRVNLLISFVPFICFFSFRSATFSLSKKLISFTLTFFPCQHKWSGNWNWHNAGSGFSSICYLYILKSFITYKIWMTSSIIPADIFRNNGLFGQSYFALDFFASDFFMPINLKLPSVVFPAH